MNSRKCVLASFLYLALTLLNAHPAPTQPLVGLDALEQFEDWPIYRQAILARQVSSADPTGGNADGSGCLYKQDSLNVIFDQEGPGCVYRLWVRNTPEAPLTVIKFFFDRDTIPDISVTVQELFSRFYYPFLSPLVGSGTVSSGGNYCYFPLPFAEHLKILTIGHVLPHQIICHLYPPGTPVTTFTGLEDPSAVVVQWQNTGSDPKDPAGNISESGNLTLQTGQTQTLFSRTGGGSITSLRLTPTPNNLSVLASLRLLFYWDDSPTPQVDCSLGSFFGTSLGPAEIAGLPVGISGGEYYCFFPMPFWDNARLDLYNTSLTSAVDVSYDLTYKTELYPENSGYFCAQHAPFSSSATKQDLMLGQLSGHGNFIGMTVTLISETDLRYLHGDLRLYLDGQSQPILQGTDFDGDFNAGNYYTTGPFSKPLHGAPVVTTGAEEKVCAYRFSLGDLIPFGNSLILRGEHGHKNSVPVEYSSVIYAFCRPEIALILSDRLDVGDQASMAAHNYASSGYAPVDHYYAYPGSYDDQFFSDHGRIIWGQSSFTASIDPENQGVRLVRRRDASTFPQSALVIVDEDTVGIWWDSDVNSYKRWGDSSFEIPIEFTQGQSQINLQFYNRSGEGWSEYYYWIYSHVPPRADADPPAQVNNLVAQEMEYGSKMFLEWDAAYDESGVAGYRIYRGTSPGVQPTEDFLVGQTPLTVFTDRALTAGSWYYYRVSALDYSGNEGPASAEASQRTSCNYVYEGENFDYFVNSSGDTSFAQYMVNYGDYWSNQQHLFYRADSLLDFFTVELEVAASDTYDVSGYFTKGPNYGILSLYVDQEAVGEQTNLYSSFIVRSPKIEFGPAYLEAGWHQFTLEASGKDPLSSNYCLGLDNVILTSHYLLPVEPGAQVKTPYAFRLSPNFPNPFNAATRLPFSLPQAGLTSLVIYDLLGRQVAVLRQGWMPAGVHAVTWKADTFSSGIYFARLQQEERTQVRKLLLLK